MAKVATDFLLEAGGLDPAVLRVIRFNGSEGMSELFGFDIDLVADSDEEISFDDIVGEKASFTWHTPDGERHIHGIVSRLEHTGQGKKVSYYTVRLVPRVWTLTLKRQCRIFQEMATPDILKKVLKDAGIPADAVSVSVKRSYKPRKYCVQYRESDFEFLSRLMEEEGIFYFFEHAEDGSKLKIADDPVANVAIEGEATLPFHEGESGLEGPDEVRTLRYARAVRSGAVMLRDYDPRKPSLDLKAESKADVETNLEVYDYPGEFGDTALGAELSKIRLQELRAERELAKGESNCRRFIPGFRFTLEEHTVEAFNQEYLLTRVEHFGDQPQAAGVDQVESQDAVPYQNRFECIPAKIPFRPARVTPRPRVEGPQTAVVTGPSGEEIHTDEHGRIKVQFHWDREGKKDDKSSCWIRVSQGWGGAGWGSVIIPRIGHEVIIEFIEGDPDRPICTGRVYNGNNPPPYGLPGAKTKSTLKSNTSPGGGGSNEIRFEDAAGGQEVFLHAQKDYNAVIENDRTRKVGHDEIIEIKNNRSKKVGVDQHEEIGSNKTIQVGADHTELIKKNKSLKVDGDHSEKVGGDMTIMVLGGITETVALNYAETVAGAMEVTVGGALAVSVGAAMAETVGGSRDASVGGASSETVGKGKTLTVADDLEEKIGKGRTVDVSKDLEETVGGQHKVTVTKESILQAKKIQIEAKDEILIKTGSASIQMKKNGDITIKGNKINVKGDSDLILKGSKIAGN